MLLLAAYLVYLGFADPHFIEIGHYGLAQLRFYTEHCIGQTGGIWRYL